MVLGEQNMTMDKFFDEDDHFGDDLPKKSQIDTEEEESHQEGGTAKFRDQMAPTDEENQIDEDELSESNEGTNDEKTAG